MRTGVLLEHVRFSLLFHFKCGITSLDRQTVSGEESMVSVQEVLNVVSSLNDTLYESLGDVTSYTMFTAEINDSFWAINYAGIQVCTSDDINLDYCDERGCYEPLEPAVRCLIRKFASHMSNVKW